MTAKCKDQVGKRKKKQGNGLSLPPFYVFTYLTKGRCTGETTEAYSDAQTNDGEHCKHAACCMLHAARPGRNPYGSATSTMSRVSEVKPVHHAARTMHREKTVSLYRENYIRSVKIA